MKIFRNYIGLSVTGHDNAIAIINSEGEVVFAEAAERYMQNKRAFCCPADDFLRIRSLIDDYCEPGAELVVAKTWSDTAVSALELEAAKIKVEMNNNTAYPSVWQQRYLAYKGFIDLFLPSIKDAANNIKSYVEGSPKWHMSSRSYDHHLTHAANGYFSSHYDRALCLVIDGLGEATATGAYKCEGNIIEPVKARRAPLDGFASLGLFYGLTLCQLCGFDGWKGEEWKVMGLAAYGQMDEELYQLMRNYMVVDGFSLRYTENSRDNYLKIMSRMRKPGQPAEDVADVAYTGQQVFAEWVSELLSNLHQLDFCDNLVLAGGCALNSSYAGKIIEHTPFKQVYVPSAPADDGNALGAAFLAYIEDHEHYKKETKVLSAYLGSTFRRETLSNLERHGKIAGLTQLQAGEAPVIAARLLAKGKIIGWGQGRAEFGPRALGNRSILADPRNPQMKDEINARVKFREEFRPFAPSILAEHGDEYFENYQETPYMERTLRFKDSVVDLVPAVVHADGTGRLQSVKREWNVDYYELIREFYRITGIPLVLNTSFNVMGKPIIHSVEDALAVFYTSGIDVMFLEDYVISKDSNLLAAVISTFKKDESVLETA
ncbi:carbamoyltransferase [Exilibacterium tricleocarpae]|uniref:Carbamoyltransferase n=1 Tax=Exilibacterium tricleocarpae TaxID=2591008 RepID=A0A545SMT3_9GAMM|nr:carbamoyltransferase C-terminal domain-containing protein [Exilibacterium tricleocarpae]TQV66320.1 carbamoyltransferase [Exilibacterium tricleocarpae]